MTVHHKKPSRKILLSKFFLIMSVLCITLIGIADDSVKVPEWSRDLYKKAEQGDANAQYNLGLSYENGRGVSKDVREAVKWYRKAAEQGCAPAQFNLGVCYCNGEGVAKDYVEAVKWYRKSAEQGCAPAQFNLGLCYYYGVGVTGDRTEAVKWFRKSAEQGDKEASEMLKKIAE